MSTVIITCPHCAGRIPRGAYCQSCGKALPFATRTEPRLIFGDNLPVGVIARQVVGHELRKQTNQAANTLLGVGLLQLIIGAIMYGAASRMAVRASDEAYVLAASFCIVGSLFLILYSWAWKSAFAASIAGLVLYGSLVLLNVLSTIGGGRVGGRGTGPAGIGVGYLDLVIVVVLYQGIRAALRQRKLQDRRATVTGGGGGGGAAATPVQALGDDDGGQAQW